MRLPTRRPWRSGNATSTVSTAPFTISSCSSAAVSIPGTVAIGEWYELLNFSALGAWRRAAGLRSLLGGIPASQRSLGCHVGGGDAAVDHEGGSRHERRVVGGEEQRGLGQLLGAPEAPHRDVHHAPRPAIRIGEELLEQRGLDRPRAERVGPDAL